MELTAEQEIAIAQSIADNPKIYGKDTAKRAKDKVKAGEKGMLAAAAAAAAAEKETNLQAEANQLANVAKMAADRAKKAGEAAYKLGEEAEKAGAAAKAHAATQVEKQSSEEPQEKD